MNSIKLFLVLLVCINLNSTLFANDQNSEANLETTSYALPNNIELIPNFIETELLPKLIHAFVSSREEKFLKSYAIYKSDAIIGVVHVIRYRDGRSPTLFPFLYDTNMTRKDIEQILAKVAVDENAKYFALPEKKHITPQDLSWPVPDLPTVLETQYVAGRDFSFNVFQTKKLDTTSIEVSLKLIGKTSSGQILETIRDNLYNFTPHRLLHFQQTQSREDPKTLTILDYILSFSFIHWPYILWSKNNTPAFKDLNLDIDTDSEYAVVDFYNLLLDLYEYFMEKQGVNIITYLDYFNKIALSRLQGILDSYDHKSPEVLQKMLVFLERLELLNLKLTPLNRVLKPAYPQSKVSMLIYNLIRAIKIKLAFNCKSIFDRKYFTDKQNTSEE